MPGWRRWCAPGRGRRRGERPGSAPRGPPGPSPDGAHVAELRILNPDGSEAELSGNGARQAALYLRRAGWTDRDELSILTQAGAVRAAITGPDTVAMEIGRA